MLKQIYLENLKKKSRFQNYLCYTWR